MSQIHVSEEVDNNTNTEEVKTDIRYNHSRKSTGLLNGDMVLCNGEMQYLIYQREKLPGFEWDLFSLIILTCNN